MSRPYHSIIIGGGHNGLACAAYLARAGKRVLLLEAARHLGGAAITRDFAPGYGVSACAHLLHQFPAAICKELDLKRHGLNFRAAAMGTILLSPDGAPVALPPAAGSNLSAEDIAAYTAFMARMRRFAAHLRPLLDAAPPSLGNGLADRGGLLRLAWQIRSLGRADMRELLRILGMNVHDLAEEHFASPALRAAVCFDAVLGANFGPRSPGSVLTLLYRLAAEHGAAAAMAQPVGGMGAVSDALAAAARAAGAELRTNARVARVLVRNDRAAGVVLADGTTLESAQVISSADPRTTFLHLLGTEHLDTGFVRRIDHFRQRGLAAKLHLALSEPPRFLGIDAAGLGARLIVAPSPTYLENAFNAAKYGEFSEFPAMEIVIPTANDPGLAPTGRHVLSAIVQYAPYAHVNGWETARNAFLERILATLETYAPGLRKLVTAAELLTPRDIEAEFGIEGGHWHHGDLALDQFYMVRPVPGAARYETPLPGLFLCGAGAHPGGGIMGVAGRNGALAVLRKAA